MNTCYTYKRKRLYAAAPGRKCVCIKSYRSTSAGELVLNKGDIVESKSHVCRARVTCQWYVHLVLSVGEQGFLEGRSKDTEGWFPSNHVQDICIFSQFFSID